MPDKVTGWTFAIVGSDAKSISKFIGFTDTYDGALKFQQNATLSGWCNVHICDANLRLVKDNQLNTFKFEVGK